MVLYRLAGSLMWYTLLLVMCCAVSRADDSQTMVTINVLGCPAMSGAPVLTASEVTRSSQERSINLMKRSAFAYRGTALMKPGTYLLNAASGSCKASIWMHVLPNHARSIALALVHGRDIREDHSFLAGTLPFAGLGLRLYDVSTHRYVETTFIYDGAAFYAENIAPGLYVLEAGFFDSTIRARFPITVPRSGLVLHISEQDLLYRIGHRVLEPAGPISPIAPIWTTSPVATVNERGDSRAVIGYGALVSVIPCDADRGTAPRAYFLTERFSPTTRLGAPLKVRTSLAAGVYLLQVDVPKPHGYLYFKSNHCGMDVSADYAAVGQRTFSVALEQGYQGNLEGYGLNVVGTLPLPSVPAVTLFPLWIPGARISGSVAGNAFYFSNLKPGKYLLRVELSSDQYADLPIDLTRAPWQGVVRLEIPLAKLHFN